MNYLKSLTLLDRSEIEKLIVESQKAPELRIAQKRLAEEVVTLVHGKEALDEALAVTQALFTGSFDELSETAFESLKNTLPVLTINQDMSLVEALVSTELASSNREARDFIKSGAVSINNTKHTDTEETLRNITLYHDKFAILRRGKKKNALLIGA